MNLSQLAVQICKKEGGKVNLSIGQVREVIKCFFEVTIEDMSDFQAMKFYSKYRKYYKRKKKK